MRSTHLELDWYGWASSMFSCSLCCCGRCCEMWCCEMLLLDDRCREEYINERIICERVKKVTWLNRLFNFYTYQFVQWFLRMTQILTVGWKLGSLMGYKPYHYAVVEAPYPSKAACTSMWSTYKVYEPLHMQWMGIWNHRQPITNALVVPDFDSQLKARVWVTTGLQTIPLCSGWGSIPIQSCMHINVEHI